jgi:hypothetical protein
VRELKAFLEGSLFKMKAAALLFVSRDDSANNSRPNQFQQYKSGLAAKHNRPGFTESRESLSIYDHGERTKRHDQQSHRDAKQLDRKLG